MRQRGDRDAGKGGGEPARDGGWQDREVVGDGTEEAEQRGFAAVRAFVRFLPALLIAAGTLYDALTPAVFTGAPLFTAAPLVAAALYSLRGTVLTGLVALVAVLAVRLRPGADVDVGAVTEVVTVAVVAVIAVVINRVVRRSGQQLASAREIAEAAQRAVVPEPAERIGGLDVAARYEAAQAGAFIGGDLYAVQDTPHGVRLVVGDVRGKGMGAVAAVAVLIGAFREAAEQEASLEAVAQRLDRALAREATRRRGVELLEGFATVVLAEVPHGRDIVRVINRGHPEPLLLDAEGALCVISSGEPALPLGMSDLGTWPDRAYETGFPSGTMLLCYTDGLSEARDEHGEFYDPAGRLAGRVFDGPGAMLAALAAEARRHSGGGMADDMVLLAVRRP
ncbi:PP2C family protein-serine/threonine phosphatase [Streptomyces sp. NPDC002896]|uniref:PP2C family protein-serine/threonine phosphatase n=1 Tax=Streptomyces sp. NPDC002896 TaxID=3154438 RepID=UPI00332EED63